MNELENVFGFILELRSSVLRDKVILPSSSVLGVLLLFHYLQFSRFYLQRYPRKGPAG